MTSEHKELYEENSKKRNASVDLDRNRSRNHAENEKIRNVKQNQ